MTHECKYPNDAKSKPKVINSSFDTASMTSREIDKKIVGLVRTGGDIYVINVQKLKEAKPDLIIDQLLRSMCTVY